MAKILYLTRNGLLEPLGQSQIWPYVRELSEKHKVSIISFEKSRNISPHTTYKEMKSICAFYEVQWVAILFRSRPRPFAQLVGIIQLGSYALVLCTGRRKPELIHARSYIAAGVALCLAWVKGIPFVFDMRALWPEELITAGRICRGSISHQILLLIERKCLKHASAVVTLTKASVSYLKHHYPLELSSKPLAVIPTCVDLNRFQYSNQIPRDPIVIGCIGTLFSGWFLTDWLVAFFSAVHRRDANIRFEIITQEDRDSAIRTLGSNCDWSSLLSIKAAAPVDMPSIIKKHTASVMFYDGSCVSELGRSPTRMAEVLASGRPVVSNAGVGDVEHVVQSREVGVIARGSSESEMDKCVKELFDLLDDTDLAMRCREAAEEFFSLDKGAVALSGIYNRCIG